MVREPKIRDAAQILREQLAEMGFTLPNQKSLDIAAKMKGYAGYQMYSQHHPDEKTPKTEKSANPAQSWLVELTQAAHSTATDAMRLAEKFDLHGEWPRFCRQDWRYEVDNRDTHLGYWEWCVHQSEGDEETSLYLENAYLVNFSDLTTHRSPRVTGWAWVTDKNDIVFDGSKPLPPVYAGLFDTPEEAIETMEETHPFTRRWYVGNPANLPPVGPGNALKELLRDFPLHEIKLTKVTRVKSKEQLEAQLEKRFLNEGEWSRFPVSQWVQASSGNSAPYWEWAIQQAAKDSEVDLNLTEVFYLTMRSDVKGGWWWTTSPDWRFLKDSSKPEIGVQFGGPVSTESALKKKLASRFPLAEQRFMGTVHFTAGGTFLASR